ncbi:MAG: hypothetical protein H0T89_19080 [Deltaproteobacteria bacterium]|nr:hypothetical protein [Deltaproteobacteria bacterium]MDQ3299716.1 hypothetical protein [Myxococcota bacterium]
MQKLLGIAFLGLLGCAVAVPQGGAPQQSGSPSAAPAGFDCNQARAELNNTQCNKEPTPGQREQCENDKMRARRQLKEQYGC